MFNFASWNYRNLIKENDIIKDYETYKYKNLSNKVLNEVLVKLQDRLVPKWANNSTIYSPCDGSGTSEYFHIALYKAISEALERWAFYETIETHPQKFSFDLDPSTTGMAALPSFTTTMARRKAMLEATERWALLEFWKGKLPVREHLSGINKLKHYEILTNFKDTHVSLLLYENDEQFLYSFACEPTIEKSFSHSLIELSRNIRVLKNFKSTKKDFYDLVDINDKRLAYFSTHEGYNLFKQKIESAPKSIHSNPQIICDLEIIGQWSKYAKVWRFLYKDSFPENQVDHTIFMF